MNMMGQEPASRTSTRDEKCFVMLIMDVVLVKCRASLSKARDSI